MSKTGSNTKQDTDIYLPLLFVALFGFMIVLLATVAYYKSQEPETSILVIQQVITLDSKIEKLESDLANAKAERKAIQDAILNAPAANAL